MPAITINYEDPRITTVLADMATLMTSNNTILADINALNVRDAQILAEIGAVNASIATLASDIQMLAAYLKAPVRIALDVIHATHAKQPIPTKKGP